MRYAVLFTTLLFVISIAGARGGPTLEGTLPSNYVPSGKLTYKTILRFLSRYRREGPRPLCFHAESTTS